jgi:aldehyde:ferredoxin oxidoreductase
MFGYMGKILKINLTESFIEEIGLDLNLAHKFLGGAGLASYFLYNNMDITSHPLGVGNNLAFFTGPLTATKFPTAVRYEVCTKSPLTNGWLDSSSSGIWGKYLKQTGYDGIIIEGISPSPVFLLIDEGKASLHEANGLWGKGTFETQFILKEKIGSKKSSVACIGPAGENLVPLACIMNDDGRAAGRGGAGAVMGSKRLKAIVVKGSKLVNMTNPDRFMEIVKKTNAILKESPPTIQRKKFGTAGSLNTNWVLGSIPVKNWKVGQWKEGCINIGGQKMAETILRPHAACFGCPIGCSRWIKIEQGEYQMEGPGPEYETLCAFGTMCLNDDLESICWVNDLCNRYGLDTISTGASISFAMEAYEKGLITKGDTGGIELTWGNKEAIVQLTELIGKKEGFGKLLGEGVRRVSEKIGGGSHEFAVHTKGMEAPMQDPRAFFSMGGTYATSPRGACHLHGLSMMFELGLTLPEAGITEKLDRHSNEGKGIPIMVAQDLSSVINSAVICYMAVLGTLPSTLKILSEALEAACGFHCTPQELLTMGERITNLQRAYNIRLGFTRKDDSLPKRLLEPVSDGPNAGKAPDLNHILDDYYRVRGWDNNGMPTRQKLSELGLIDVADDLKIK